MNTVTANVPATESLFDPHAYFKTHNGLRGSDSFNYRILPNVAPMPYRGLEGVTSSVLARNMYDKGIIDELLGGMEEVHKHAFTLDQIAEIIGSQPNGEDGELMNDGYANIFYVLVNGVVVAVRVGWDWRGRHWSVRVWYLNENGDWRAGGRVFRNTTLTI
jgi:hypothetical protein